MKNFVQLDSLTGKPIYLDPKYVVFIKEEDDFQEPACKLFLAHGGTPLTVKGNLPAVVSTLKGAA